jgi:DNA-binding Lrp family transcriptional regulator
MTARGPLLDPVDRALIVATQGGLPLVSRPYEAVGHGLGISGDEVVARLRALLASGIIRRIGANGMTVWDVDDAQVDLLGPKVGALECVTHCYRRPRALPDWPYNLFAMVHGGSREEVLGKAAIIADILGAAARARDVLFSSRILKKTGLRI